VEVGGLYSVVRAGETFGVVKVLAHQPEVDAIYARIFSARARKRPAIDWFEGQEPGDLDEELGVGIGVLPVTSRVFAFWQPAFLFAQEITEAEREDLGYCLGMAQPWDDLKFA
jgi:hypothetical protein